MVGGEDDTERGGCSDWWDEGFNREAAVGGWEGGCLGYESGRGLEMSLGFVVIFN